MTEMTQDPLVIVVAYRNTDDLNRCLAALGGWGDLIVVDNDDDPTVERLVERAQGRYLASGRNIGFAAAVNVGLRYRSSGQDVLLLNPDAELQPADADRLVQALRDVPRRAAVAPRLRNPDGTEQRTEWPVPSPREAWIDALGLRRWMRPKQRFLSGAVLLLDEKALEEVGGFDERYFLYAEECDWQVRAQQSGWTIAAVDDVQVPHTGGGSSSDYEVKEVLFHRSGEAFGRKWYGGRGWHVMRLASITGALRRLVTNSMRPERRKYAYLLRLSVRGTERA